MAVSRLTIAAVSFRSGHFLDLNWKLAQTLNPPPLPPWVVVENTPPDQQSPLEAPAGLTIVPGVAPPTGIPGKVVGSYHHAAALQKALPHLQTRYALILDPDFYIVLPGWVDLVLNHMEKHGLAFFGVPWHPRWFEKYRSFPCVHCMFIDLSQVDQADLDFRPEGLAGSRALAWRKKVERKIPAALSPLYRAGRKAWLACSQVERLQIGRRADTGTRVFRRFSAPAAYRSETALPVFREERDALAPLHARSRVARTIERLLPERFRYFPESSSFTRRDFAERGFPSARPLGCEEFVWQDQPFGFHFRGTAQAAELQETRQAALADLIAAFCRRNPTNH